ncbi:MAG: hypothetical protein QW424_01325 [Candidatus Bathyarchaeia archaeon]
MNVHYNEHWTQDLVLRWINEVIRDFGVGLIRAGQEVQIRSG